MKQRDTYVDVAKGICMLLIICIHTEVFGVIGLTFTSIAVPMFFFMSGFYDRSEKSIKQWLPKSIRTLVFPAVAWVIIAVVYLSILSFVKDKSIRGYHFNLYNPVDGNGPVWFLIALVYAKILTWLGHFLKYRWLILLVSVILGYIGSKVDLPLLIDDGLEALPLYYCGKIIYPRIKNLIVSKWSVIIGTLSYIIILLHYSYYTIAPIGICPVAPYYVVAFAVSCLSFLFILALSEKLQNIRILQNIGTHSLGIMLTHALICHTFAVVLNRIFEVGSDMWIVLGIISYFIIAALSYAITIIAERYMPVLLGK